MSSYRIVLGCAVVGFGAAGAGGATTLSLTAITNTTSNFSGTILIQGTVVVGAGDTFYSPTVWSSHSMPFLASYAAGFNGSGQGFDPGFLAWNGMGTYSGAILNHQISTNNLGYAGGMPVGLYGSNLLGPGGQSSIILHYYDASGADHAMVASYAINVVPAPGAFAVFTLGGLLASRRRR